MKPRFVPAAVAAFLLMTAGGCENTSTNPQGAKSSAAPEVYELRFVTVAPQVMHRVSPVLTPGVRRRSSQGEALVDFVVDDQGQAQMVRAIKATTPEFGDAAVAAMMQWRFSPGQKDGRVVWTHLQMPIVFSATEP